MWGLKKHTRHQSAQRQQFQIVTEQNRRDIEEDRREFKEPTKFPFIDRSGRLVKLDRRSAPDRRISNINVTEYHLNFDTTLFTGRK